MPTPPQTPPQPVREPSTYGKAEVGCWTVHVDYTNDVSWGPFDTKTEARAFMVEVNPNMFAVNNTELPDFFNI